MTKKAKEVTSWVGWIFFAGFMMVLNGMFNAVIGLTAVLNSDWLIVTDSQFLILDLTAWGWVHMAMGVLLVWAGMAVMRGQVFARMVGVVAALAGSVGALTTVEAYPLWSIMMLVIYLIIVYALIVHGEELEE